MPESQQIEFIIRKDGTVEERVTGVSGPDCEKITDAIESALGKVTRREKTSDYYDEAQGSTDTVQADS